MPQQPLHPSHFGVTHCTMQMGAITFTKAVYEPNTSFSTHAHQNACFTLIHRGGYQESFGKTRLTAQPQSVIFRPPEATHSDTFGAAQVVCSLLEIKCEWYEQLSQQVTILNEPVGFDNGEIVWQALKLWHEFQQIDEVSQLAIEGLMLEMLAKTTRSIRKNNLRTPPRWLQQAKEILQDQFSENLSLNEIAQTVNVHPSYLANSFRAFFKPVSAHICGNCASNSPAVN